MCAVHDGRCSPWVMCSVVSGNRIHDTGGREIKQQYNIFTIMTGLLSHVKKYIAYT